MKRTLLVAAMLAWPTIPSLAMTCEDAASIMGKSGDNHPSDTIDDSALRFTAAGWAMHYGSVHKCPQFGGEFAADTPWTEDDLGCYFMGAIKSLNRRHP